MNSDTCRGILMNLTDERKGQTVCAEPVPPLTRGLLFDG